MATQGKQKQDLFSSFSLFLPFSFLFFVVLALFLSKPPGRSPETRTAGGLLLPQGKQTYLIQSNPQSPRFTKATIDPLDVKVGDIQKMEVEVEDTEAPIVSIKADIETDTGTTTQTLIFKEGNASKGIWSGSWLVRDTHSKTYRTTFIAINAKQEETSITLTWSDPCTPPLGGDWTLDGNCAISGVNGVDNGTFTVSNFTLTLNAGATFVWNPARSMIITNGALAIADTAKLQKTYLWMEDGDADGYTKTTNQVAQDIQPTNHRRRYQIPSISTTDCSDTDINAWRLRYGIASCQASGLTCVGNQSGYYDTNYFRVFVSSTLHLGDFWEYNSSKFNGEYGGSGKKGVGAADEICGKLAQWAGLPGTYTSWTSSLSSRPQDRGLAACAAAGANSVGWFRVDGATRVAYNWNHLTRRAFFHPDWGTFYGDGHTIGLSNPIQKNEFGVDGGVGIYTGTDSFGAATSNTCEGFTWQWNSRLGSIGSALLTGVIDGNPSWMNWQQNGCGSPYNLYCFQSAP